MTKIRTDSRAAANKGANKMAGKSVGEVFTIQVALR